MKIKFLSKYKSDLPFLCWLLPQFEIFHIQVKMYWTPYLHIFHQICFVETD